MFFKYGKAQQLAVGARWDSFPSTQLIKYCDRMPESRNSGIRVGIPAVINTHATIEELLLLCNGMVNTPL
jgi:hypothetical protein